MITLFGVAMAAPADPGEAVERAHMTVLTTWAVTNLATGTAAGLGTEREPQRSFHLSNAGWNTVNLAIAAGSWVGLQRRRAHPLPDLSKHHRRLQTTLAVNLGLDVLYVASGLALRARGGAWQGLDLTGVGTSLIVQGGFLAAFDASFLLFHRRATRRD